MYSSFNFLKENNLINRNEITNGLCKVLRQWAEWFYTQAKTLYILLYIYISGKCL